MPVLRSLWLCLPLLLALSSAAADTARMMRLATLEWPPYVGTHLPEGGLSAAVVSAAARHAGYRTTIDFFDWAMTMERGQKDPAYAGFFPEYLTAARLASCHTSAAIGTSTLVLATLKEHPLQWNTLTDLSEVTVGVVEGYSNGEAFDAMVAQRQQPVVTATSDTLNLRNLTSRRVPAIVIDSEVLRYLLSTSGTRDDIVTSGPPLAELTLHICFKRTPEGREMQQAFDAGLRKVDVRQIGKAYMERLESESR
jgi:polar amino acid transport system substrate-binding protein